MKTVFGIVGVGLLVLWSTAFVFRGQNPVIGKSRSGDVDVVDGNDTDAMVRAMHRGRPYISVYTHDVEKKQSVSGDTLTFEKCEGPLPILVCTVTASNYGHLEGIYFRARASRDDIEKETSVEIPGAYVSAPRYLHGTFEIEVLVPARANSISISHRGY